MTDDDPNRPTSGASQSGFKMSEVDDGPPRKKGRRGCWITLAVLAFLVGSVVYIIFFTSIPARYFLSKASKEDGFEAEGVSGSLASGRSAVNVFRFDTGAEKMSEVHGFEIIYPSFGPYKDGEFVIETLTVESAILNLDSQNLERPPEEEKEKKPEEEEPKKERDRSGPRGFRMGSLEVKNVTINVVDLGWKLEFPEGLKISEVYSGSGIMSVGGLSMRGDAISLEIPSFGSPADKEKPTTVAATLTFTPALSPTVVQNIPLEITLTFPKGKLPTTQISAFGSRAGAGNIPDSEGLWSLKTENLTVDEWVTGWFPGTEIHLDASYHNESGKWDSLTTGHFNLGDHRFTIDTFENQPTDTFHASTSEIDGTKISVAIKFADGFGAPVLTFSSEPPLPESEIQKLLGAPRP